MFGRKKKQYEDEEYYYDEYEDDDEYEDEEYEDEDNEEEYGANNNDSLLNEIKQLEDEKVLLNKEIKNSRRLVKEQGEELERVLLKLSRVEEIKSQHSALQESYGTLQEEFSKAKADLEDTERKFATQEAELLTSKTELADMTEKKSKAESQLESLEGQLRSALTQSKEYEDHASQLSEVGAVLLEAKSQAKQIVLEACSEAEGIRLIAEEEARKIHDKAFVKLQIIKRESETIQQGLETWRDDLTANLNQLVEKSRYILAGAKAREEEEQ